MYAPNKHADAVDQRLRHMKSSESADAPPQRAVTPARRYDTWQLRPALRPPSDTHISADLGEANLEYSPELRDIDMNLLQHTCCSSRNQLPIQALHRTSLQPFIPVVNHLGVGQPENGHISNCEQLGLAETRPVLNGLLLNHEDYTPQSSKQFTLGAISSDWPIWNTDGFGSDRQRSSSQHPSHAALYRHLYVPEHPAVYGTGPLQPQVYQFAAPQTAHLRRHSSVASSPSLNHDCGQSNQFPAVQEWRTDNLTEHSVSFRKKPDAAIKRSREKYRQKRELRRNTIAAGMRDKQTLAHRTSPSIVTAIPKRATRPPTKRRKVTATSSTKAQPSSKLNFTTVYQGANEDQENAEAASDLRESQPPAYQPSMVPSLSADELPQAIVDEYDDYKWSVYHYELHSEGYDFAEPWLQALLDSILYVDFKKRHFSHVSQGFIKDGNRHSLIVLHNAADPFEYDTTPTSTITIGVYGYHWYQHREIHWTTLASDQRQLLALCLQQGCLVQKYKWTHDAKPTEKRFHRAYWLAANQQHVKGLLNRGPLEDKPHDRVEERSEEDPDRDFKISEADLTNEWNVMGAEAATAWCMVQGEVDALGAGFDVCGAGWEHTVIASSEW